MTTNKITTSENNPDRHHTKIINTRTTKTRARTAPPSEHYAIQTNKNQEQEPKTKRSKARTEDAHRCITIHGSALASGRRRATLLSHAGRIDLAQRADVMRTWWSGC